MNIRRLALYFVFVMYQAGAFVFTYMVDGHLDLLGLLKFIPWFKYITSLGMVLIIADVTLFVIESRASNRQKKDLIAENEGLKAKISGLQNADGTSSDSKV